MYLWSFARGDRLGVYDFSSFVLVLFCSGFFGLFGLSFGFFLFFVFFSFLFFVYLCFAFTSVFTVLLALTQKLLFKVRILHSCVSSP